MKLILDENILDRPAEAFLRDVGYNYLVDRNSGQESYVRPLNRGFYPRFHLYLERQSGQVILNLHLDQKQASYKGAHAHNAEYDGQVVEAEMDRIKSYTTRNFNF